MLYDFALFTPCVTCIIFGLILLLEKEKSVSHVLMTVLSIVSAIYFFIDANYVSPNVNFKSLVYMDFISQFITLCMFPLIVIYLKSSLGFKIHTVFGCMAFAPALVMGAAAATIYKTMGVDNAARYIEAFNAAGTAPEGFTGAIYDVHNLFTMYIYNSVLLLYVLGAMLYISLILKKNDFQFKDIELFFFKDRASSPINMISCLIFIILTICVIRIILGRVFLLNHQGLSATLSLILALLLLLTMYIGLNYENTKVKLSDLKTPDEKAKRETDKFLDIDSDTEQPKDFSTVTKDKLKERFASYITEEKPYLNPVLTIEDVATALNSNRTYISALVKDSFESNFRAYINGLRIEEAKKLLLERPDDILSSIALDSGFASDSQLVKKFSEMEGMSPRAWLKSNQ